MNETVFLQKDLDYLKSQSYDVKTPELKFASGLLIPISEETPAGANTMSYYTYEHTGLAKVISDYADDLPNASVKAKEETIKLYDIGSSFGYSDQEILASRYANKDLDQKKMAAAKKANMSQLDKIGLLGEPNSKMYGLYNHPNILEYIVPNGASGQTEWSTKTADEILEDMTNLVDTIVTTTKEVESPDTLLLPTAAYSIITNTRIPNVNTTIKKFFLDNNGRITNIFSVARLTGLGAGGTNVMIAYRRDANNLQMEVPTMFEMRPQTRQNLLTTIPCVTRTGGVVIYYPLSVCKAEGI